MKKSILLLCLLVGNLQAFATNKGVLKCSLSKSGIEVFISFVDLDKKTALIAYSGDDITDATDEFQLKLQAQKGDVLNFYADNPQNYPGAMSLKVHSTKLLQKAEFTAEGKTITFIGRCTKI